MAHMADTAVPLFWTERNRLGEWRASHYIRCMKITINGDERQLPEGCTVRELLDVLEIKTKAVAVERNMQIVPRMEHEGCRLQEGDRLEIVTLVGGG